MILYSHNFFNLSILRSGKYVYFLIQKDSKNEVLQYGNTTKLRPHDLIYHFDFFFLDCLHKHRNQFRIKLFPGFFL